MTKDMQIPNYKELDKILHDRMIEEVKDALIHQHDDEDVDDAIINGLDDD